MKRSRRRGLRSALLALAVLIACVGAALFLFDQPEPVPQAALVAAPAAAALERTAALPALKLPADDAAHGSGMEWWYYSGILDAADNKRYSFHMAVFVANALVKHTVMHVALTDLQDGRRYTHQRRTAGLPATPSAAGFDFRQENWQAAGNGSSHKVRADFEGVSLQLALQDANPVVAHRAAGSQTPGLLDFGEAGISYYYSRPRMVAQGELSLPGQAAVELRGPVWFDHQWGDFDVTRLGWNWLALHLSDGSDAMVYQLFDREGRVVTTTGTLTPKGGPSRPLAPGEATLEPLRRWTSPRSKVEYVVEWQLRLPSGELRVQPFFDDSEFDAGATSANLYWEGPVKLSGSAQGEGFLELSGYERLRPDR